MLTNAPDEPCPASFSESVLRNDCKLALPSSEDPPRELSKFWKLVSKFDVDDVLLLSEALEVLPSAEVDVASDVALLVNLEIKLSNLLCISPPPIPIGGGGGGGISLSLEEVSEDWLLLEVLDCDCSAATKFCIKLSKLDCAVASVELLESLVLADVVESVAVDEASEES